MNYKVKNTALLIALLLAGFNSRTWAQSSLDKGWQAFYQNKTDDARKNFEAAAADPKTQQEAYLALSIMATIDKTSDDAYAQFSNFYKSSSNPYPYLYAMWNTPSVFDGSKLTDGQVNFLKQLLADPKADGTLKSMAHQQLGRHYFAVNNLAEAKKEYALTQSVQDWQVAGSFENISGSGFDKNYDPIANPDNSKVFVNKNGAQVKWFNLPPNRLDNWVDFSYPFYQRNTVNYAQTFVNSDADRDVQLRIGTSGSVKVWLNDYQVFSESEERDNDLDNYVVKVKLHKGYNRLLLQIGCSEIENSNFLVRFTDADGASLAGLTYSKTPQGYTKETGNYTVAVVKNPAEDYFEKKLASEPDNILNYIVLSEAYLHNDKEFEARQVLEKAVKMVPNCSYVRFKIATLYSRMDDKTDLTSTVSWLKDHDADNPISLLLLYQEDIDKEDYTSAEALVDKLEKIYGQDETIIQKRIELAGYNKKQDEVISLANLGYKKFPDSYTYVYMQHLIATDMDKNTPKAIKILKTYLKSNYSLDAMQTLANDYFGQGNISAGVKTYQEMIEHDPGDPGLYYDLADEYYQMHDAENAIANYKKAIDLAPYIGSYWDELAKVYDDKNESADAIAAYTKAITYEPTNYEARKSLRKLQGKKEIFDNFEQPDVYALIKNAPDASKFPEDNSLVLLDETQKVVYGGGASEEKHVVVIKVFNSQGIDDWKDYGIDYNSMQRLVIEKAEAVKANGTKVDAETNDNEVVFSTLEPGDALHITYRLENYMTGKLAPHFWDKVYFRHNYPFSDTKYSLLISPDVKFQYAISNGEKIDPEKSKVDEFDKYVWERKDVASIKHEDHMAALSDVAPVLFISSFPDWTFISNWYADLTANKIKSDYEIKQTVQELFKDKPNLTQMQKVQEIYNYIVHNVRYSEVSFLQSGLIPQKASKVLNTKIGDCKDVSILFVTMCREIGVDAQPVLVRTRDYGRKNMLLPSIAFNHCIAKFTLDNKAYYIELTSDYLPFNTFYSDLMNAYTLDVTPEGSGTKVTAQYLNPNSRNQNLIRRFADIQVKDNDMVVSKTSYRTGALAADIRSTYRDLGKKEQEKKMHESLTTEMPNVTLTNLEFTNLDNTSDSVIYKYAYSGANAVTQVGGLNLFSLPWSDKTGSSDFVFADNREFPMDVYDMVSTDNDVETITISLPSNKVLAEVPKSLAYTCSAADYKLDFKVQGNKIVATRSLRFKKDIIPVEEIPEFKTFYKNVLTADTKQFAFK
jgi:tetratricopeptide (TPR) repeat protein